ncbi:hypothetical protein QYM36_004068 [Artemia franciscana]|uniref:BSD domain-containing protein n=1 Tax=Artemia franciscana TaxID=6661 RepID=A0AA88LBE8_ARTSF|nr:hypothetical protein QYM36_004068 [Artemia franciscana]
MASEDILLMVPFVRHKKIDGSLYVMETRIGWIPEGKETFAISHNYIDIKMQKVSPADKPRIQLQVVLNDDNSTTFLFSNPEGKESQMKDREKVKDWLIQLLPKFKIKISKELEEKNRILKENPLVLQLYKELVIPEVVSSEVFWTEFAPPLIKVSEPEEKQVVGVSSGFLAEIKPQADGVNDLRVNLTKNMIDSIFRTYPAVQKKYEALVPRKMTATSFWEKFIHSYYFQREREKDDIFNECAKTEDMDFVRDVRSGVKDPLSDLTRLVETEFATDNESIESQPSLFQPLLRSEEIQNELRELYRAVCELLRHFWSTLTTQQPGGDEKILIVFESLINFQKKKLKPFEDKLKAQRESVDAANITRHLQCLLQIADKKFKRWDEMRQK